MLDLPDARYITGFVSRPQKQVKRKNADEDYYPSSSDTYTESFTSSREGSCSTPSDAPTDSTTDEVTLARERKASTQASPINKATKSSSTKDFVTELCDEEQAELQLDEQKELAFADEVPFQQTDTEAALLREYPSLALLHTIIQQEKPTKAVKETTRSSVSLAMQAFQERDYIEAINILKQCIADDPRAYTAFEMLASFYETIIREQLFLKHAKLAKLLRVSNKPQSLAENILLMAALEFQLAATILQPSTEKFLVLITDYLKVRKLSKALYCLHKLLPLFISGLDDLYCNNLLERDSQILVFERDMCSIFNRFMLENPGDVTMSNRGILLSFNRKICSHLMYAPYVETHTLRFIDKVSDLETSRPYRIRYASKRIAFLLDQQVRMLEVSGLLSGIINRLLDLLYKTKRYESIIELLNTLLEFALRSVGSRKGQEKAEYKRYICLFSLHKAAVEVILTLQSVVSALKALGTDSSADMNGLMVRRISKASILHIKNVLTTFYSSTYHPQYDNELEDVSTFLLEALADAIWLTRTRNMALINDLVVNIDADTRLPKKLFSRSDAESQDPIMSNDAALEPAMQTSLARLTEHFDLTFSKLVLDTVTCYLELLQAQETTSSLHKRSISRLFIVSSRIQALQGCHKAKIAKQLGMAFKYHKGVGPRKELVRFIYTQQTDGYATLVASETADTEATSELEITRNMKMILDIVHPRFALPESSNTDDAPSAIAVKVPLISYPETYGIVFAEHIAIPIKRDLTLKEPNEFEQDTSCIVETYSSTNLQLHALFSLFSSYIALENTRARSKVRLSIEAFLENYYPNQEFDSLELLARTAFFVGFSLLFTDAYLLPANYPRPRYTYKLFASLRHNYEHKTEHQLVTKFQTVIDNFFTAHPLRIFRNSILLSLPEDIESCRWELGLFLRGLSDGRMRSHLVPGETVARIDFYLFIIELQQILGKRLEAGGAYQGISCRSSVLLSILFFITERCPKIGDIVAHAKHLEHMHFLAKDLIHKTGIVSMQYSYQRGRCLSNPYSMQDYTILIRHYQQADPSLPIGKFLKRMLRKCPDSVPVMFAMAATFFQSCYFRDAISIYEKLCPLCFSDDIFRALGQDGMRISNASFEKREIAKRSMQASVCYTLAIAYLHISGNKKVHTKARHIAMGLRYLQLFAVCAGQNLKLTHLAVALILMYYCHRLDLAEVMLQKIIRSKYGPSLSSDFFNRPLYLSVFPRASSNSLLNLTDDFDSSKNFFFEQYMTQPPPPRQPYTPENEQSIVWTAAHALVLIYLTTGSTESANYILSRYLTFTSIS
ncbi:hypothetical protein QR46_2392 [Giardia duodenalis assemblage B]|uniref:Uncharacterized protein n=1 Tax=Giardia duodenalis assemblage B TaxID=1394984 RepID=A0A132NU73_GIAIN|nr:hypothetical protein QR46_2392 [Giardia intestinalis assemblage B]